MTTTVISRPAGRTQRIALLRLPPFLGYKRPHPRDVTLPLTIGYAATMIQASGRTPAVIDLWGSGATLEDLLDRVARFRPDVVILEANAAAFPIVMKVAAAIRDLCGPWVLAFGSVPTFNPERIITADSPVHVAMLGEVEETTMELLAARDGTTALSDVAGIAYWDHDQNRMICTRSRPEIDDLDALPLIDYALLDMRQYHMYSFPMPIDREVRWGQILASRGCPYPCSHCSLDHRQTFGRRFRRVSPGTFVDNIERLVRDHGITAISIEDDIFSLDRKHVLAICDEIERRTPDVKWVAQTRVDCIDPELIHRMKRTGCVGLTFGIEAGNDRVLAVLKKGFTRQQALDGIRMAQDAGLMLRLLFMIGNPTETAAEIRDTIDLACQANAITVQAHICTPYPGTSLLGEAEGDGDHIDDFSSYDKVVYNMSACSDEELWKLQKEFYRRYYFSWHYLRLFLRQRVRYMPASWRRDVPLILRALWYLLWTSRRPEARDMEATIRAATTRSNGHGHAKSPRSPLPLHPSQPAATSNQV